MSSTFCITSCLVWSISSRIRCSLCSRSFRNSASCLRSSSSSLFSASIMSCMALTCWRTVCSCTWVAGTPGTPSGAKERRSLGIWYWMKSCMRSCVSLISLVRLSSGKFSRRSSCGLICTTTMPNRVLSNCIARKALANRCCSGDSDSMASLNSLGVGMVARSRGICSSSLFCSSTACLASKPVAEVTWPKSTMKELNCRARATSESLAPVSLEN
mmetsp:Transcript_56957/g.135814  ORF Transcript_56957/g.135814 Transcript_56957/m.135814 type:complete len:215 (+) Transcript_56957:863-1507(+)